MRKQNQRPMSKEEKAFKKTVKATKVYLESIQKDFNEDYTSCSGCNFGAIARMKKKQEEKLRAAIRIVDEKKESQSDVQKPKKVIVKIKKKPAA